MPPSVGSGLSSDPTSLCAAVHDLRARTVRSPNDLVGAASVE